jgi:hypothetical protein
MNASSNKLARLLLRVMYVVICCTCVLVCLVATLLPRIPPFMGYFMCRVINDFGIQDYCDLNADLSLMIFGSNNYAILFGIVGGLVGVVIFIPAVWHAMLMALYEILPSMIFQRRCLDQFREESKNAMHGNYQEVLKKFRQLSILNLKFNEVYATDFFVIVIAAVPLIIVPSGCFLLTTYDAHLSILMLGVFIVTMEYTTMTAILVFASTVWNASVEFKWAWNKNLQISSRALPRRYCIGDPFRILKS